MALRRPLPNQRLRADGMAIRRETDRLDRTEAAIAWIQDRAAQVKRIVATQSEIQHFRVPARHSEGR